MEYASFSALDQLDKLASQAGLSFEQVDLGHLRGGFLRV